MALGQLRGVLQERAAIGDAVREAQLFPLVRVALID